MVGLIGLVVLSVEVLWWMLVLRANLFARTSDPKHVFPLRPKSFSGPVEVNLRCLAPKPVWSSNGQEIANNSTHGLCFGPQAILCQNLLFVGEHFAA